MAGEQVNLLKVETPTMAGQPNLNQPQFMATSPEGYKFYEKLVAADHMFLSTMSMMLIGSSLVPIQGNDPTSPIPGMRLVAIEDQDGKKIEPNISYKGYITVTNNYILSVSPAISTSVIDERLHSPEKFSVLETMAITDMMVANRKEWKFTNPTLIRSLGLAMFKNIYHISRRSVRGTFITKLMHPWMYKAEGESMQDDKPRARFPNFLPR